MAKKYKCSRKHWAKDKSVKEHEELPKLRPYIKQHRQYVRHHCRLIAKDVEHYMNLSFKPYKEFKTDFFWWFY